MKKIICAVVICAVAAAEAATTKWSWSCDLLPNENRQNNLAKNDMRSLLLLDMTGFAGTNCDNPVIKNKGDPLALTDANRLLGTILIDPAKQKDDSWLPMEISFRGIVTHILDVIKTGFQIPNAPVPPTVATAN